MDDGGNDGGAERPAERAGGPPPQMAGLTLDFGTRGLRAAIAQSGSNFSVGLDLVGLTPTSLLTVVEPAAAPEELPAFPSLLERLGDDRVTLLDGRVGRKPHVHLFNILDSLASPLQRWWGPIGSLAIVLPQSVNPIQRKRIVDQAESAGWGKARLVNKTTALAFHALQRSRPGDYLALVLGHAAAEASLVRWEGKQLRVLSYATETELSGGHLDAIMLRLVVQSLRQSGGRGLPTEVYDANDWLRLRALVEAARHRLDLYETVNLEIPRSLSDGSPAEIVIRRKEWAKVTERQQPLISSLIGRCCGEAGVDRQLVQGCVATGGLLMQTTLRDQLSESFQSTRLVFLGPEAQVLGASQLAAREGAAELETSGARAASQPPVPRSRVNEVRIPADEGAAAATRRQGQDMLGEIIENVRSLAGSGKMADARAHLQRLKDYIGAVELSLESPADALRVLGGTGSAQLGAAFAFKQADPADPLNERPPDGSALPPAPVKDEAAVARSEKRKFALARDDLKKAEIALKGGRLEQAVRYSHSAYHTSQDGKIFQAMIEVHVRAGTRREPAIQNFEDDRRWLQCALSDDATNEKVQAALSRRYLVHVKQLAELGTQKDHSAAISILGELLRLVPGVEQAESWLHQLKEAAPGGAHLTFDGPAAV